MAKLPEGHSISAHKDVVGQTMHRWKHRDPKALHSGVGKKGKEGKVVTDPKQAIAIALSIAGKSKGGKKGKTADHAERLMSMGYSEEVANQVTEMLYGELDWAKNFETGQGISENKQNYKTDPWFERNTDAVSDIESKRGKQPGDMGKLKVNSESEMLSGPALPKGPGNPQGGSSKEVFGLRMLG